MLVGLTASLPLAHAHGDLHEQIARATEAIEKDPRNADLYLRRGEWHRHHEDWDAALADYERASVLAPKLDLAHLARGRLFLDLNWPQAAIECVNRFLAVHPRHVEALVTRARARAKIGQRLAAAEDYAQACEHSTESRPELYIERAEALMAEGEAHWDEALRGLDRGLKRLGPLVTLQLYAVDLEVKRRRFDAALKRLEAVASQTRRPETWLARRGEILQQAGRGAEAQAAYTQALEAIARLPAARRDVPAMRELEKRLRSALDTLAAAPPKTEQ